MFVVIISGYRKKSRRLCYGPFPNEATAVAFAEPFIGDRFLRVQIAPLLAPV